MESCYWHLIEKHFCYDESIALYEEPPDPETNNNTFDNHMFFYDQVALIAGRSIVTIEPLSTYEKPIEHQPVRKLKWWEDVIDKQAPIKTISEKIEEKPVIKPESAVVVVVKVEEPKQEEPSAEVEIKQVPLSKSVPSNLLSVDVSPEKERKKSLRERRMSRSLTLNIDRNLELPVIKILSMPHFYVDTPEANQLEHSSLAAPSTALTTPVIPRSMTEYFDLRSIVQIENEQRSVQVPVHRQGMSPSSKLSVLKDKLKIKRQGSSSNLPRSLQHL